MGRQAKAKPSKRVQLRLSGDCLRVVERLTSDEISDVLEQAIASGIRPGKKLGATVQAIIRPSKMVTKTLTRISVQGRTVRVLFPEKLDSFREIMRSHLFQWEKPCWQRTVPEEVVADRAAEIAHALVLSGYAVQVDHTEIRDRVVQERFEPEVFRCIKVRVSGLHEGWFDFSYPRSDDFYEDLMRLTAAKYVDGSVVVPPEHFAEVEDFAEVNGFQFSPKAREALENARSLWESALMLQPRRKRQKQTVQPKNQNEGIPAHLLDDE